MEKMVYSMQEAADALGISKSYMYELVRKGEVPVLVIGKRRVIPKEKFNRWIKGDQRNGKKKQW